MPKCPTCGESVAKSNPNLPFCSERCRLLDLGQWLEGSYRISSEKVSETEEREEE